MEKQDTVKLARDLVESLSLIISETSQSPGFWCDIVSNKLEGCGGVDCKSCPFNSAKNMNYTSGMLEKLCGEQ